MKAFEIVCLSLAGLAGAIIIGGWIKVMTAPKAPNPAKQ